MKHVLLAVFALVIFGSINAQEKYDTTAPFRKTKTIPDFKILQTDSTWFTNKQIPANRPVVIVYFSPECGHCQLTAQEFVKDMDQLKNVFFIWTSYHSVDQIKDFAKQYKLDRYKNVVLGRDPNYFLPSFYRVKFTPFMAVYGKNGKLLETFDQGTSPETIAKLAKK